MTDDTTDETTDAQHTKDATPGAGTLAGLLVGGALGLGGVGTASADPQGQVGTSDDPLQALYTNALDGGVTGNNSLTSLTGDGLTISSNALSAAPARPDVDDGATSVADASELSFGSGLTVTDDGDGTVTVSLDTGLTLSVSGFDIGERGAGDTFTVDVTVAEANVASLSNVALTLSDVTVSLTVTDPDGTTVYDQQLTTDVPSGGTQVTFGVDGSTDEVGPLNSGDHTATVTADAANTDSATANDTFTVRDSSLDVTSFAIDDQPTDQSFTVDATVAETANSQTQDLTVTLTVDAPDGTTVYDRTIDPGTELQDESTTVTFGQDDGTPEVGPLGDDVEYTATVTATVSNGGPATGSDAFTGVERHASAPDDRQAVLDAMAQDDDGTYVVTNDHELQAMAADTSADYRLGNDIFAGLTAQWNGGSGFDPIGSSSDFTGTFDGAGHTISNLTVDRGNNVGLFAVTDSGGVIERVCVENVDITGNTAVGGLVGNNQGTVQQSSVSGSVFGNAGYVGGLVGLNEGSVSESYATSAVEGDEKVGGLIGQQRSSVELSYATGSVDGDRNVGGLVGDSTGDIRQTFATGTVTGRDSTLTGGLVGDGYRSRVYRSYWDSRATGQRSSDGGTPLTTSEMQGDEADDNMSGLDFSAEWETVDAANDGDVSSDDYPVLQALDRERQLAVR